MRSETRRMLFAILAGLAFAGLFVAILAIVLAPPGIAYWIYGALAVVIVALVAEIVLLFVGRPPKPQDEAYDFVIDGSEGH